MTRSNPGSDPAVRPEHVEEGQPEPTAPADDSDDDNENEEEKDDDDDDDDDVDADTALSWWSGGPAGEGLVVVAAGGQRDVRRDGPVHAPR